MFGAYEFVTIFTESSTVFVHRFFTSAQIANFNFISKGYIVFANGAFLDDGVVIINIFSVIIHDLLLYIGYSIGHVFLTCPMCFCLRLYVRLLRPFIYDTSFDSSRLLKGNNLDIDGA